MKFFVPIVEPKEYEQVFDAIAQFNGAPTPPNKKDRIYAVAWTRFGQDRYAARVGEPIHPDFGGEIVMAIIQTTLSSFAICTANHGVVRGTAIHANFNDVTSTEKFTG